MIVFAAREAPLRISYRCFLAAAAKPCAFTEHRLDVEALRTLRERPALFGEALLDVAQAFDEDPLLSVEGLDPIANDLKGSKE